MKNFLLELSIIHIVLVLAYWLMLQKEQQYGHKRFYLIFASLLSIVIPILKLPKLFKSSEAMVASPDLTIVSTESISVAHTSVQPFWTDQLLLAIYLTVSGMLLCRLLFNIWKVIRLEHKSHLEYFDGYTIRRTSHDLASFTFFNWIFLNNNIRKDHQEYKVILKHEEAHASLKHTYDLLLFEIYAVCFWWLPSAWFVQKEIKKIHEYQADAYALRTYDVDQYSSILIRSTLRSHGLRLANSFHDGLILKRLNAMKQQTTKVSTWKLGSLTTLIFMLITLFACTEEKLVAQNLGEPISVEEIFKVVEEQPSYEGGMDAFYSYLKNEVRYPAIARNNGVEGQVYVQFNIERSGSVSYVSVVRDIGAGCGEEAERIMNKVSSFKPGKQRGRTVKTVMVLPVNFKLDATKVNDDNSPQGSVVIGELQMIKERLQLSVKYKDGAWHGKLEDNNGKPLPGANIVVEGTNYGRVSDLDGTFSVEATPSQDVTISYVGYESIRLSEKD